MFLLFLLSFLIVSAPASGADSFWQKVTWTSPQNVVLVGLYHPASRSKADTWVLLHGLGSVKEEWEAFGRQMGKEGMGILLYDARGHQESNRLANGQVIHYQDWVRSGPGTPWDGMASDLASAVDFLRNQYHVREKKIAVGGASLGANVALVYASEHKHVPAIVLLSAGVEYAGINIAQPWVHFASRPVFIAASPQDSDAFATLQFLVQQRPKIPGRIAEGRGAEHGVQMFKDPQFAAKLLAWMKEVE